MKGGTLIAHSFARFRTITLLMALLLSAFQILLILAAVTLHETDTFGDLGLLMPPVFRDLFGESLFVFISFAGIVAFGYFHPMIVAALVGLVIAVVTEPAGEVETRFLDALLARPIGRSTIVTRTAVLVVSLPALILVAMAASSAAGLRFLVPEGVVVPGLRLIASLVLNIWALLVSIGGVVLVAAVAARRRSAVAGAAALVSFALFLVDYLARVWEPARAAVWLSPFHYFDAMSLVTGGALPLSDIGVLAGSGALGVAAAYVTFSHRDV